MKRHKSDPEQFDAFRVFEQYARAKDLSINDESVIKQFSEEFPDLIRSHRDRKILVYGLHAQSMFAHIAAALGNCAIINEEDSGIFFSLETDIRRPDFRIVTKEGESFFVEVKNFHPRDPLKELRIKIDYVESLKKYTSKFNIPLKFAIYWSKWNIWTMIDIDYFDRKKSYYKISMPESMKRNDMILIGDKMIGAEHPLSLRLYTEPTKPHSIDKNGKVSFTIGKVELCVKGKPISDKLEQQLAWFFMLYGRWDKIEQIAHMENEKPEYVDISISPGEFEEHQRFDIIDSLSNMLSMRYIDLTSSKGKINKLIPDKQPEEMSVLIPHDYKGKVLRLRRITLKPNYDDVIKNGS